MQKFWLIGFKLYCLTLYLWNKVLFSRKEYYSKYFISLRVNALFIKSFTNKRVSYFEIGHGERLWSCPLAFLFTILTQFRFHPKLLHGFEPVLKILIWLCWLTIFPLTRYKPLEIFIKDVIFLHICSYYAPSYYLECSIILSNMV